MCPVFQNFSKSKQKHDRRCCCKITAENGYSNCCRIKNRNFYLSSGKCTDTFPDIFYRTQCSKYCSYRHRKKNLLSIMEHNMIYHFFPVFTVHLPPGVLKIAFRCLRMTVRKPLHSFQNFRLISIITDHGILIAFCHFCRGHAFKPSEKVLQLICLTAGHSFLAEMNPHPASDLMFYFEFHIIFPPAMIFITTGIPVFYSSVVSSAVSSVVSSVSSTVSSSAASSKISSAAARSSLICLASA